MTSLVATGVSSAAFSEAPLAIALASGTGVQASAIGSVAEDDADDGSLPAVAASSSSLT
jgi:hypothetical protein